MGLSPCRSESAALISQHFLSTHALPLPSGAITPIRAFKMPLIPQLELLCPQARLEQQPRPCHKQGILLE